jgi:MFS family permease
MRRRAPLYALFAADSISLTGNAVTQLAIPWFVLVETGSPLLTGIAVLVSMLPVVLSGFFGGVIVDRLGFRTTSIVSDLASAVSVAAIPALYTTVGLELWQLLLLAFAGALLDAPGNTARAALFPDVVALAAVQMERATGIRGAIQRGSLLVGAPIGGLLVAELGATTALWLDAASFLASAALVAGVVPAARRAVEHEARRRYLHELREGLSFIRRHRLVRAVVLTVLVTNFLDAPIPVVMPVFAREAFGSAVDLGLMYGVFGGFALLGSLVFSAVGMRLPRRLTFVSCFVVWAADYLVLATLPSFPVTLAALAVGGFAVGPINPLLMAVEYELIPPNLRGRVLGAIQAGAWSAIPIGILLGGAVVEAVGPGWTLLGIGVCYVAVTAYGFFNPAFQELDRRPGLEAEAAGAADEPVPSTTGRTSR